MPEVQKNIAGFIESKHGYDLGAVDKPIANVPPRRSQTSKRKAGENGDVVIVPSVLESGLNKAPLGAKYYARMKKSSGVGEDDLSDIFAENAKKAKTLFQTCKFQMILLSSCYTSHQPVWLPSATPNHYL